MWSDDGEDREDDEDKEDDEEKDEDDDDDEEEEDDADDVLERQVLSLPLPSAVLSATILQGREAPNPLPSLTTTLSSVLF